MTDQTTRQSRPILDLPTAVREMGALPMPAGNERQALSAERLADIAAREDAATPGPWEHYTQYGPTFFANTTGPYLQGVGDLNFGEGEQARADEEFVKHAREDVPALLAEIRHLKADREANDREYEQATARIAALEAERHTTNEALSDAAEQLRRQRDRIDVLEKAAVEGRAALASFCSDHEDPGTAALGALYLLQQATSGTPLQPGETVPKVYRASHDAIVMGLYLTAAAARAHCEAEERRAETSESTFDWIEDDEDGVAELVAETVCGEEETGYVVTVLEIAAEYDAEADQ